MTQRSANASLVLGLVFFGAVAVTFLVTQNTGFPFLVTRLPAVHGLLTALSALQAQGSTSARPRDIPLELGCASGLSLAFPVAWLGHGSMVGLLAGWGMVLLATLTLVLATALEIRQLPRIQRFQGSTNVRFLAQGLALLIYGLITLWLAYLAAVWLMVWLSGEPYMGR